MKRPVQEPTPTGRKGVPEGTEYEHPAYAQIQASRAGLKHLGADPVKLAISGPTKEDEDERSEG